MTNKDYDARSQNSFGQQAFMATIGASLRLEQPGVAEVVLASVSGLTQQNGFLHGGVIATIADVAGGYAAYSLFGDGDDVLTVEFKLNLLAPARGTSARAIGRVLRSGRTLTVCSIEVFDQMDEGEAKLCAVAQQTLMRIASPHLHAASA